MIRINDKSDCCGCSACASVCSYNAITMKPDAMGFLYPETDVNKCVECGLCEKVCAFNDNYDKSLNLSVPEAYGARHKDMSEVETSRSGAVFVAISDWILEHGGVVYGAGYADHFRVVHKRAVTKEERDEFKGSKYVQSDMGDIFRRVKQDLREGRIVLFSGTPCQTAGLNSYIGKRYRENLYLVDIVCHGVPSPLLWEKYINFLEKMKNDQIVTVNFRDKQLFGWSSHHESFCFKKEPDKKVIYSFTFYKDILIRKSCENCKYSNLKRPSDITIGDFWGYEKTCSEFNKDNKGISLILINTNKGLVFFNKIKERFTFKSVSINDCLQPNLQKPIGEDIKREKFEKDFKRFGFLFVSLKYKNIRYRTFIKLIVNRIFGLWQK